MGAVQCPSEFSAQFGLADGRRSHTVEHAVEFGVFDEVDKKANEVVDVDPALPLPAAAHGASEAEPIEGEELAEHATAA